MTEGRSTGNDNAPRPPAAPFRQESPALAHREAFVNGIRLHYVEAGTGPLVLLLHGFPEFHVGWRHQIPALANAGFRVIAPDLRGYNLSDKPRGVAAYQIECLVDEVIGLIRHAGEARAALVGHDWGGTIAFAAAMRYPETIEHLAVLNAPHPAIFARDLRSVEQMIRSSYAAAFQVPKVPEVILRARNFALLRRMLRHDPRRPGSFTDADIDAYVASWSRPGALTAAINYYRAAARSRLLARRTLQPTHQQSLLIWGDRDRYLRRSLTSDLDVWLPNLRIEHFPNASHWVQHDEPERVNALLIDFLAQQ